jgi:hypothetical protein
LRFAGGRGRTGLAVAGGAVACAGALAASVLGAHGTPGAAVIPTIDGRGSNEARETIPITRERGAAPFVVLSQRLKTGGGLARGDVIRATSEFQLSTTCVHDEPRCIGSRYSYSPRMDGQLVLASSPNATGGAAADPISRTVTRRCNQQRPNRNHHCVFPFTDGAKRVRNLGNLPCPPDACYLNAVASADHPSAGPGDVVVVGADRPDGSVDGDKARIDGLVLRGAVPPPRLKEGGKKVRDSVLIAPSGGEGRKVVRSLRINDLRKGDALRVFGRQRMGIDHLPYGVYVGTRMILATSPTETRTNGFVANVMSNGGEITEMNGFNCTQGASEYRHPCPTHKAATAYVKRKMPVRNGEPKPVFVNIVVAGLAKLAKAGPNDRMRVLDGKVETQRYRVPKGP